MPIKIGLTEEDVRGKSLFLTVTPEAPIAAQIIIDLDHVVQGTFCHMKHNEEELIWVYTGDDDPCHDFDFNPRFSVIVPCIVKEKSGKVVRYIRGPKQFNRELLRLNTRYESIQGLIVEFRREDGDFAKYSILPQGKRVKVTEDQDEVLEEFLSDIFDGTADETREWLQEKGVTIKAKIDTKKFEEEEL